MSSVPAPAPYQPGEPSPGPQRIPSAPGPQRPRRWWIGALAGVALLGGLLYLAMRPDQTKTGGGEIVHPTGTAASAVKTHLRLSGQTSARNYAQIIVPTFRGPDSGRDLTLMKCPKPGAFVKKGDPIAELDPQSLKDHIDDTADTVQQAENDVLKRRAEHDVDRTSLEQNLKIAKANLDKARLDLKAAEVKTPIERELYKLAADEADATYTQLQKEAAQRRAAQKAEIRILEITVARQKVHLNNHVTDLKKFTIRAPMDGLVVMAQTWRGGEMKQVQEGDQVYAGQQLMKIVDTRSMQVEAFVSQADSSNFRVGQTARIGLDAFPGLEFHGKIYSIGAIATKGVWDTYYIRNVPVKIMIEGSDPRLIPDLSAWAHIEERTQLAQQ